jgi:predicted transglutaminase-like protease
VAPTIKKGEGGHMVRLWQKIVQIMDRIEKKTPLWTRAELRKEEVRGLFAIGVVALLISVRSVVAEVTFKAALLGQVTIKDLVDGLTLAWGIYIILMAIALADDLFKKVPLLRLDRIPRFCKLFAQIYFVWPVIFLLGLIALIFWPYVLILIFVAVLIGIISLTITIQRRLAKRKLDKESRRLWWLKRKFYKRKEKEPPFVPTIEDIDSDEIKKLSNRLTGITPKEMLTNIVEWQDRNLKFWEDRWPAADVLKVTALLAFLFGIFTPLFGLLIYFALFSSGIAVYIFLDSVRRSRIIKRTAPGFRLLDTLEPSLPVEKILEYRLAVCRDYAKLTSALLLNNFPENELYFLMIPNHRAAAVKLNNRVYVLDQKLPILTLSKWVQRWKERLHKSNLKPESKKIVKDSKRITTVKEQLEQYIETPSEHTRINTERIAGELKKKLMIKDMGKRHESKNSIEITIPFQNYANIYEEDEIIEFSIVESMKNRIEDELTGNLDEILDLTVTRNDGNLVVNIQQAVR